MNINNAGFTIPGAITSTEFSRKPATHLQSALASGHPLLIIKGKTVLCAIVPVSTREDFAQYLRADPAMAEGE